MAEALRSFPEGEPTPTQSQDAMPDNVVYLFAQPGETEPLTELAVVETTVPTMPSPTGELLLTPRIIKRSKIAAGIGALLGSIPGFVQLIATNEGVTYTFMTYGVFGTIVGGAGSIGLRYLDLRFPERYNLDEK